MDFDKHFGILDTLEEKEEKNIEIRCCQDEANYSISDNMIICKVCNNTITNISSDAEWKYYGSNEKNNDPTRCGMPINQLLPESSVGSTVSFNKNSASMNKIRQCQQWHSMPYKERSLYKVFIEIADVCKKNNIPEIIINHSKLLYTIISETKISRGSNRKGIIAACVYFACKECNVPRSSNEIAKMFSLENTVMTKGCKKCKELIAMSKSEKKVDLKTKSISPEDFINRFCNKLELNEKFINIIYNVCKISLKNNIISENTPPSIASGCIYYVIKKKNLSISKKDISNICLISEVTINKCCKRLEQNDDLFHECLN